MNRALLCLLCLLPVACDSSPGEDAGTGTDAGPDIDTGMTMDDSGMPDGGAPPCGAASALEMVSGVSLAHVADIDADDRVELLVAGAAGGLFVYDLDDCRATFRDMALDGVMITGLDVGDFNNSGGDDIVVQTDARALVALSGDDLAELWRDPALTLASAGPAITAHLDTDGDHDVAAFDAPLANLLRIENAATMWNTRVTVGLPPGIQRVAAGNLGDGERDELLFLGGGLVEVVSRADFDFSDVRPLSTSPHGAAAFGDFDGDGNNDVMITAGSVVELWTGDGATHITSGASVDLGAEVTDLATVQTAIRPGAAALVGGEVVIVSSTGDPTLAMRASGTTIGASTAMRVFAGDANGDRRWQPIVVTSDAMVHVLP